MDMKKQTEHKDLEERFHLSAEVDFGSSSTEFEGLKDFEIEKVKKKKVKTKIENIELRKSNTTGGLF